MATRCLDPAYRTHEQVANMEQRENVWTNPERRKQENERNAEAMAIRHLDPVHRIKEKVADTAQRRLAREQLGVLVNKALERRDINDMATKFVH